jgi:hypothetical protein
MVCGKMKIKVRTIIKNLATLLLLPLTSVFIIVMPLLYRCLPFQYWIWGYGNEQEFHILLYETILYETFNAILPLISLCLLVISILIKNKTNKNKCRNISIVLLTITNIFWLYSFGSTFGSLFWLPLCSIFALLLLAIYSLLWLSEQLKGKITIVNE